MLPRPANTAEVCTESHDHIPESKHRQLSALRIVCPTEFRSYGSPEVLFYQLREGDKLSTSMPYMLMVRYRGPIKTLKTITVRFLVTIALAG